MEQFFTILAGKGLEGVVIAGLAYAYWLKDKALERSNRERIADNEKLYETVSILREALTIIRAHGND